VQERVEEMLANQKTEESYSTYVNPLTLVQRDGKHVRMSRCWGSQQVYYAGFKQRLFANTIVRILKEMGSLPVLEKGAPIYTRIIWFPKFSHCFIRAFQSVLGADASEYTLHYIENSS
jgi:hypothetical protein